MKEIILQTSDGYPLVIHLFEPEKSNGKLLLLNSATGVKQQIYFGFAEFFADHGYTVITYDYRGVGLSKPGKMKGFESSMLIWGTRDYKAVTDFIQKNFADYIKFCLGHSVGALILGMNEDSKIFRKFIFVATQDAYIGHLPPKVAVGALLGFGLMVPLTTSVLGYFPAHWFRLGESLPTGSALDWQTLVLNPKSTKILFEKLEVKIPAELHQETLIIYAEDDPWVTMKGMESLMKTSYQNMKPTYRKIKILESPERNIGHINFFRSYNRNLWHIVLSELN